jgi:hypothetical protein
MDLITGELSKKFSGQALTAAEGYSGQMDRLTVASNNAKEIIGKDLLDSLNLLSGPGGISKSTTQMEDLAKAIGDTVYGLALLIDKVKSIPGASFIMSGFGEILTNLQPFAGLRNLGRSSKATPAQSPGERKQIDKINKDALKFQKQQNALKKIDNDNTARKITLTGDQLALQELENFTPVSNHSSHQSNAGASSAGYTQKSGSPFKSSSNTASTKSLIIKAILFWRVALLKNLIASSILVIFPTGVVDNNCRTI